MFKISIKDFIEEVKGELYCYDEIEEEKIIFWEQNFLKLLNESKLKTIELSNNELIFDDESEVFQIADGFWSAIINNNEDEYWETI